MTLFKYIAFAIIATIVNLTSQAISFYFYSDFLAIYIAMFIGTLSGLSCKYYLDKHYIFSYQTKNKQEDAQRFFLYSLMGVFTTLIFWFVEVIFDYYFTHPYAKYLGAIIGLSIGYLIKYHLDKHFVFKKDDQGDHYVN
jgi:putative flippase GtrA